MANKMIVRAKSIDSHKFVNMNICKTNAKTSSHIITHLRVGHQNLYTKGCSIFVLLGNNSVHYFLRQW